MIVISVEIRKAKSLMMKLAVRKVNQTYSSVDVKETISDTNWTAVRNALKGKTDRKIHPNVSFDKVNMDGVAVEITSPKVKKSENIMIYIHGGAYVVGLLNYGRAYAEMLALESGCTVYSVDYSLSPENKYPVALDECERVYRQIRNEYPKSKIAFIGDSAGAGFSISLALRLKAKKLKLPSCLILHSPVIDLSGKLDRTVNIKVNRDRIVQPKTANGFVDIYAGSADTKNCEISPMYGEFSGFPPVFVTCESHETLLADSLELDKMMERVGVKVKTVQIDGGCHACAAMGTFVPETKILMKEYIAFMQEAFEK